MSKNLSLKAELRERTGSKQAAAARLRGRLPAVVYGHKKETLAVSIDAHDFAQGLHHGHRLLDLKVGGKTETVLIKDLQYDHLGRDLVHVDLQRVDVTELVRVSVPIELKGTAEGTHHGGIIEEHVDRLEIECRVTDIPESIAVSVRDVNVGDALHAGQVELPAGIRLTSSPELVLVTCHLVAAAKTAEQAAEEAPTAPEVIGEAERAARAAEQAEQG